MTEPNKEAIESALEKILASPAFQASRRMSRFLRFVVEHALKGDNAPLKEYVIGVNVFDRGEEFDPRTDTIVRVEARRLRSKLKEYYEAEGTADPVIIELSQRGYVPAFRAKAQPMASAGPARHWKLALAGVIMVVALTAVGRLAPTGTTLETNSIVVLPFANLTGDPQGEYLGDGLTEEIIGALATIPEIRVVARTSSFQFKARSVDIRKVGRDLNVKTALEGSVRREGQRVRVSAQLINVFDGLHLWSKMYDLELTSLLEIEEDISRAIVDALKVRLADRNTRKTPNIEAHELYLKGQYFFNKLTPGDLKKSIAFYEQAIARDNNYAAAHAGLATAYGVWLNLELEGPWEHSEQAKTAAQKALDLDDGLAEGHAVMGAFLALLDWDWRGSEREFRRALALKPSLALAGETYAVLCLGPLRRYNEAIEEFRKVLVLDPLSVNLRTFLGQTYVYAGRPDEGISQVRTALELEPGFPMAHMTLALAELERFSYSGALQVLQPLQDLAEEIPTYRGLLGYTHARLGNRKEAERVLAELKSQFPGPWVPPVEVAGIYNGLGDTELALQWLERGCQQRSSQMPFIIDDPRFRNLYSDTRFKAVLRRMNLDR